MIRKVFLILLALVLALSVGLVACGGAGEEEEEEEEEIRANFSATPTSGTAPLEVQFTDESEGDVDGWEWDFDDDGTIDSTDQNPTYTYTSAGIYTVSLEVSGPDGSDTERKVDYITVEEAVVIETGTAIQVISQTVQPSGETIEITDSSSPLYGLKIQVPEAAAEEDISFTVSYADITGVSGLPEEASVASKLISIETSGSEIWNEYKAFDEPITVTLPYDPSLVSGDEPVRFYYYDEESNTLDSAGFVSQDSTNHTITFYAGTFSDFVAIKLRLLTWELLGMDFSVDTGFRPLTDGWFFPNYGSYLEPGGICMGMVSFAKYYYKHKKSVAGVGLYEEYREGDPDEWRDDATAIQIGTRVQRAMPWGAVLNKVAEYRPSSEDVALSWLHGMKVTGEPQLLGLRTQYANNTTAPGGHAVMTYQYSNGRFDIYDPNFPGTAPGTGVRQILFTYGEGFDENYSSGATAGAGDREYNLFDHFGSKLFHPIKFYHELYDSAEKKFKDDTFFPTVTLTSPTTPVDTDGDGMRDTSENKATISGTISGGLKAVTSTLLFVSRQKFKVPVVDGSFSQEVPLLQGDNEIVILATHENARTKWAGYLKDIIRCTASRASLTFTLTWGQGNSDVDLHVLEPAIEATEGRHIYYGNRGSQYDGYPYLDIDNVWGYGPEHYYATEDMTLPNYPGPGKSLYGTYRFRVHYYADHDDDYENTQPITWHVTVRYLAYEDELSGREFWEENAWSRYLTVESSYDSHDFYNPGASWSVTYVVEYPQPEPEDYGTPPPPQNELP